MANIIKYEDLPKGWVIIGIDLSLELTEAQYNDIMNAKNDQDTGFKAFKAVIDEHNKMREEEGDD